MCVFVVPIMSDDYVFYEDCVLQRDVEKSTGHAPVTLPQLLGCYFLIWDTWSFTIIVWPAAPPLLSHFREDGKGEVMRLDKDKRIKRRQPLCLLSASSKKICHLFIIADEVTTNT